MTKVLFQLLMLHNEPPQNGVNTIVQLCSWILWVKNLEKVLGRWLVSVPRCLGP